MAQISENDICEVRQFIQGSKVINQVTPIDDSLNEIMYVGSAMVNFQIGANGETVPHEIRFEIPGSNLEEAFNNYTDAANEELSNIQERMREEQNNSSRGPENTLHIPTAEESAAVQNSHKFQQ